METAPVIDFDIMKNLNTLSENLECFVKLLAEWKTENEVWRSRLDQMGETMTATKTTMQAVAKNYLLENDQLKKPVQSKNLASISEAEPQQLTHIGESAMRTLPINFLKKDNQLKTAPIGKLML